MNKKLNMNPSSTEQANQISIDFANFDFTGQRIKTILACLRLDQIIDLLQTADEPVATEIFHNIETKHQNYAYPLLGKQKMKIIHDMQSEDRKKELDSVLVSFEKINECFNTDPTNPMSFISYLSALNSKLTNKWSFDKKCQSFLIPASKLFKDYNFSCESFDNSETDANFVERMKQAIIESGLIFGSISIAITSEKNPIQIIDGKHRWKALQQLGELAKTNEVIDKLFNVIKVQIDIFFCQQMKDQQKSRFLQLAQYNKNLP